MKGLLWILQRLLWHNLQNCQVSIQILGLLIHFCQLNQVNLNRRLFHIHSFFLLVTTGLINIGGGGDSFYEYLIKNYLLQESKDKDLLTTWQNSVESIEKYLLSPTAKDPSIQFVAMLSINSVYYASQELVRCFFFYSTKKYSKFR